MQRYIRDMAGYGSRPPAAQWPHGAKIAVQFVLNYEEGGENCTLHGDPASEAFLSEIVGASAWPDQRHWNMESIYEYGARAGFWRLHDMFTIRQIPLTVYGVATALARSPEQVAAMVEADWEIASHGLKWIEYKDMAPEEERADINAAKALHTAVTGTAPRGWYTGRCSVNTMRLIAEDGSFDYVSDSYADDLPYWLDGTDRPQLVIPYTLDANDMRFATPQGFNTGEHFYTYLKDTFDKLHAEGLAGHPKMMSIGLHCRLAGRPGRAAALERFLDYVKGHADAWVCRRVDIAEHWAKTHPYAAPTLRPSQMNKATFVEILGGVFEHSPWIAERAFDGELGPANDTAIGIHSALAIQFRLATEQERLGVLVAHPDLAGKLAQAERLTAESTSEQAGAGLNALTDEERETFTELNAAYVDRFGFPFIIAVRDHDKAGILEAFRARLPHTRDLEFAEACRQVERIALHRLKDLFAQAPTVATPSTHKDTRP